MTGLAVSGMRAEVVDLEHPWIVLAPEAAGSTEGRDAAFHRDARAREGGEIAGGADKRAAASRMACVTFDAVNSECTLSPISRPG